MEFTFHNAYVILGLVASKDAHLLTKTLLNQGYIELIANNSTVVITNWLTITNGNDSFSFQVDFPSIPKKTFTGLDYECYTMIATSEAGTAYRSGAPGFTLAFLCGVL